MGRYRVEVDGEEIDVEVEWTGDAYRATVGDESWEVDVRQLDEAEPSDEPLPEDEDMGWDEQKGHIYAPISGSVSKILVSEGDTVEEGQSVIKLEAMKMQTEISTGRSGRVKEILVKPADRVKENELLIRLEDSH